MAKNFSFKIIALSMLVCLMLFGATANLYAAGPEPGDEIKFKAGRIDAVATLVFVPSGIPGLPGNANTIIAGRCVKKVGEEPVVLNPFVFSQAADEISFAAATARDLEGYELEGFGPPDCFSADGGETLIVTHVQKIHNSVSPDGTLIIGADITLKAIK